MSVANSDLVIYMALNKPTDDTGTAGGDINSSMEILLYLIYPLLILPILVSCGEMVQILKFLKVKYYE